MSLVSSAVVSKCEVSKSAACGFAVAKPHAVMASLPDIGHQRHEACAFDRILDRALERGTIAGALAAEELALTGAKLLQRLHVLVVHERRPRTALFRAEPAAILPAPSELLANHRR